jgi:hypothetical protein
MGLFDMCRFSGTVAHGSLAANRIEFGYGSAAGQAIFPGWTLMNALHFEKGNGT